MWALGCCCPWLEPQKGEVGGTDLADVRDAGQCGGGVAEKGKLLEGGHPAAQLGVVRVARPRLELLAHDRDGLRRRRRRRRSGVSSGGEGLGSHRAHTGERPEGATLHPPPRRDELPRLRHLQEEEVRTLGGLGGPPLARRRRLVIRREQKADGDAPSHLPEVEEGAVDTGEEVVVVVEAAAALAAAAAAVVEVVEVEEEVGR